MNTLRIIENDSETSSLKIQKRELEEQLNDLLTEKLEIEKLLLDFQHRHSFELGEIILNILKAKKSRFKNDRKKYEEANNDYQQYKDQFQTERRKTRLKISEREREDLKRKFRKACLLCHPDKVNDEFKKAAEKIFIELQSAYQFNDLKRVEAILNDLEKGNYFKRELDSLNEKQEIKAAIRIIILKIKEVETQLLEIKMSDVYKTVILISNWDDYFTNIKKSLMQDLEALKLN